MKAPLTAAEDFGIFPYNSGVCMIMVLYYGIFFAAQTQEMPNGAGAINDGMHCAQAQAFCGNSHAFRRVDVFCAQNLGRAEQT